MSFTEEDRRDFNALEQKVETGKRQAFEALRTIRQRQLWKLIRSNHGEQLYKTFDQYIEDRWGHTRQWVTHGTNWLAITEEMERLGITEPPHLTIKAAQALVSGRLTEAGGLRGVLEEAAQDGVPLDQSHLQEIVQRNADYSYYSVNGQEGTDKPAATTYGQYKKDLALVKDVLGGGKSYVVWTEAEKLEGSLTDNLVAVCEERGELPDTKRLLAVFTGEALHDVVVKLTPLAANLKDIEAKKSLLTARKKELDELRQSQGIRRLKEETKALEEDLVKAGVLTKRKGTSQDDAENDDAVSDSDPSDVRSDLTAALESLHSALEDDWEIESEEFDHVLLTIRECEATLKEILVKATSREKVLAEELTSVEAN